MEPIEFRCSGLARVMACAGSSFFTDLPPNETNAAAEEGTAAGEMLRYRLEKSDLTWPRIASNGVQFDDDMRFYTEPIAQEIVSRAARAPICEQRIDWQTRSGIWIRGQYDVSFVGHDGALYIDDLKYGWGLVEVSREKPNWQLLGYAIGEVLRLNRPFNEIVLRIHQPRPHHEDGSTREWRMNLNELNSYKEQIEAQMQKIAMGDRTLTTSDKCKYCPASGERCPAFNKMFFKGVEYSHEFTQDKIDDDELSRQLDLVARVSEVLKIKSDSLKALAVDRLNRGIVIPNYVREASYGDRKWKPDVSPEMIETLTGKNVIEKVMLSPAKAEKMGVPKEFVKACVTQPFLGQKLKRANHSKLGAKIFGDKANG